MYIQDCGVLAEKPIRAPGSACKQFTIFVDKVVGNLRRSPCRRRNHVVMSSLLKISSKLRLISTRDVTGEAPTEK